MQKKFLRTSILTLVLGVSHMNEIHAMDYEEQSRDAWYAQNKREREWLNEMSTCRERDDNQGDLHTRVQGNDIWTSEITGVTHDRWEDPTCWAEEEGLKMIPGKRFIHCEGCAKLRFNLLEAHRGEWDRYMKRNNSPKKSPMPQPPRLNLTTWETWTPSIAVAPPEPEPTHDAPSPHFASRPDEQQTDNWDTCESWSSGESDQEAKIDWTSLMTEYPEKPETQCDDENYRPFGSGWAADDWDDDEKHKHYEPMPEQSPGGYQTYSEMVDELEKYPFPPIEEPTPAVIADARARVQQDIAEYDNMRRLAAVNDKMKSEGDSKPKPRVRTERQCPSRIPRLHGGTWVEKPMGR